MEFDEYWKNNWKSSATMPKVFDLAMREIAERAWMAAISSEREACANLCESLFDMDDDSCDEAEKCAAAIRARSN